MGVWGDGVFDGDGASGFLGGVVRHLAAVIDEGLRLARPGRPHPTLRSAVLARGRVLSLHEPVAPAVALLDAILARVPAARVCLGKGRVRAWRRAYFEWYEAEFVPVNGPSERYRANVRRAFDRLLRKAEGEDE